MSCFGDPKVVRARLRAFRDSARVFSSDRPRLINEYPNKWVAVYQGKVVAHSQDFDDLMRSVNEREHQDILVRFIDNDQRGLII